MDFRFPMDRYLRALASLARDNPQSSAYFFNCYIVLWIFSAIFRLLSSVLHCDMEILRNLPLTFPTVTWHNLRNLSLTFSSVIHVCVVEIPRNLFSVLHSGVEILSNLPAALAKCCIIYTVGILYDFLLTFTRSSVLCTEHTEVWVFRDLLHEGRTWNFLKKLIPLQWEIYICTLFFISFAHFLKYFLHTFFNIFCALNFVYLLRTPKFVPPLLFCIFLFLRSNYCLMQSQIQYIIKWICKNFAESATTRASGNWSRRKGPAISTLNSGKSKVEMRVYINSVFDTVICWAQ